MNSFGAAVRSMRLRTLPLSLAGVLLTLPLFVIHLYGVWTRTDRALDRFFPLLVFGTFLLALLF